MEHSILPTDNLKTKIYWSFLLCVSLVLCGFAGFQSASFSPRQYLILVIAIAVSVFANQYQVTIPKTSSNFSAKEILIFWGIIWLGIPGGVFIAVAASLARFYIVGKNKMRWLFGVFTDVCAAFAAGLIFYAVLHNSGSFAGNFVAEEDVSLIWLAAATVLMAAAHYVLSGILNSIFLNLEDESNLREVWQINFD